MVKYSPPTQKADVKQLAAFLPENAFRHNNKVLAVKPGPFVCPREFL